MSRQRALVGLDLGSRDIKLAWRESPRQPLENAVFTRRGDDASELQRVSSLLRLRGLRRPLVGLHAPDQLVRAVVVDVPAKGGQAPREAIAEQSFYRELGLPPGSRDLRISETPDSSRRGAAEQMLVMGVESEACTLVCESAWHAGLDVAFVGTSADEASIEASHAGAVGITLILDMGWHNARVMLVKEGQVALHRASSGVGLRDAVEAMAEQMQADSGEDGSQGAAMELAEALLLDPDKAGLHRDLWSGAIERWAQLVCEDLRSGMAYALHRYPEAEITTCVGVGGGALIPGAVESLRVHFMGELTCDVQIAHSWHANAMVNALEASERA